MAELDDDFAAGAPEAALRMRYRGVRTATRRLCDPLAIEDYVVQSMPDVSPTKWHLAHTSWFFETFVLARALTDYRVFSPEFAYLFNSYYETVGTMHARSARGLLSRPTVQEVFDYRAHVDAAMAQLLAGQVAPPLRDAIEIGLHHEQQHQELMLTDIKHVLSCNPLRPSYRAGSGGPRAVRAGAPAMGWKAFEAGLRWIGHEGDGFAYDNEGPRHRRHLEPFALGTRLVTAGEYLAFMEDGGYSRPELWLSDGWATVCREGWQSPLYWERTEDGWSVFTLDGLQALDPNVPVAHVSYYEADAFARWYGARLPAEDEWEVAAAGLPVEGNFVERGALSPRPAGSGAPGLVQMFGDLWEWTRSPYQAYPGFRPFAGSLGEYNGKFMCNQLVLRGGSCATPASHMRATYRNFFPPQTRWQLSGIRLARDTA